MAVGGACSGLQYRLYRDNTDPYVRYISNTIEAVVNYKKHEYVGHSYDRDDLAQDLRIKLIESAQSLSSGIPPFSYLVQCANNRIADLRKGTYQSNNPPCKECSKPHGSCQDDGLKCDSWLNYERTLRIKQKIDSPHLLGDGDVVQTDSVWDSVMGTEFNERIIRALPSYLLKSYHNMLNGGVVSTAHKSKIRIIVLEVMHGKTI